MCLGVPAVVCRRYERHGIAVGEADFGGVRREVCLEYVPEAASGDHVLVHAGFALSVIDPAHAREMLEWIDALTLDADAGGTP